MNARVALILATAMTCGLAATAVFAQDAMPASAGTAMSHDAMQKAPMKSDAMKSGSMKMDASKSNMMHKDAMKSDAMKPDAMKKDSMKKDGSAMSSGG